VSGTAQGTIDGEVFVHLQDTVTIEGETDVAWCSWVWSGIPQVQSCWCDVVGTVSGQLVEADVTGLSCNIDCASTTVSCTGASCYCDCTVDIDCTCEITGGKVYVPIDDVVADLDCVCNVEMERLWISGVCSHTHNFTGQGDVDVQGTFPLTGTCEIDFQAIADGLQGTCSGTGTVTGIELEIEIPSHTHTFASSVTVPSYVVQGTFSAPLSGCMECEPYSHRHSFIGNLTDQEFTGNLTTNYDTHTHPVELTFSGALSGEIECTSETHEHEFEIPCREVNLCLDWSGDIDIASEFVPGYCTIRIAVVNKNFWEYFWYALCICTRAIWHEAEFGPAKCEINETPDCDEECELIDCEELEYDCPEPVPPVRDMANGQNVSWFGFATDTTLLNTDHDCVENLIINQPRSAVCSSLSLPSVSDCCLDLSGCGGIDDFGNGQNRAPNPPAGDGNGLVNYCPDPNAGNFLEAPFLRDLHAGLFDFIADDAQDHIPAGVGPIGP
jgi:hypothetical protein